MGSKKNIHKKIDTKILLIGGSGNLGTEIIRSKLFDNIVAPKKKSLNLLATVQINKILNRFKPKIIIHCASLARMKECEKDKNKAIKNNILATLNLIKEIKKYEKRNKVFVHLIYLSSDAVYPSLKGNHKESSKLGPYNVYGWTKLCAEYLVKILKKYTIIRTRFFIRKKINYKFSASDIFTSQVEITLLPKYIKYLILEKYYGVINVGGKRISDFKLYKKINPHLKAFKRKNLINQLKFSIAKDSSLNLKTFNNIKKNYE